MRHEIFRAERVTYRREDIIFLRDFQLNIYAGECMGLLPLDSFGLDELLDVLRNNIPVFNGYIYYQGRMINSWRGDPAHGSEQPHIAVITGRSSLAACLSVSVNIFIIRPDTREQIINKKLYRKLLQPVFQETGVDISPDRIAEDLSSFERIIVEIIRAVIHDNRLIVLKELGNEISREELAKLKEIIRFYCSQGFSFLYISSNADEILQMSDRVAFMQSGTIIKVLSSGEFTDPEKKIFLQKASDYPAALIRDPGCEMMICPNVDAAHRKFSELAAMREKDCACISAHPEESMFFPDMSVYDNLCFNSDQRIRDIWISQRVRKSIAFEYSRMFASMEQPAGTLSKSDRVKLVYERILFQEPHHVIIETPFVNEDLKHRLRITDNIMKMLRAGIRVTILTIENEKIR